MQSPSGKSDLLSLRRKPLSDITNGAKSNDARLAMAEAEKKIAEVMFATAFKEKEMIRVQTIKTLDLMTDQVKRAEYSLTCANSTISAQNVRLDESVLVDLANKQTLKDMQNKICNLESSLSTAEDTMAEYEYDLSEKLDQIRSQGQQIDSLINQNLDGKELLVDANMTVGKLNSRHEELKSLYRMRRTSVN